MLVYGRSKRTLRFSHQARPEETLDIRTGQYGVTPSGIPLSTPLDFSGDDSPHLRPVAQSQEVTTPQKAPGNKHTFDRLATSTSNSWTTHHGPRPNRVNEASAPMKGSKHKAFTRDKDDGGSTSSGYVKSDRRLARPLFRMEVDLGDDSDSSDHGDIGGVERLTNSGKREDISREIQGELVEAGAYENATMLDGKIPKKTRYMFGLGGKYGMVNRASERGGTISVTSMSNTRPGIQSDMSSLLCAEPRGGGTLTTHQSATEERKVFHWEEDGPSVNKHGERENHITQSHRVAAGVSEGIVASSFLVEGRGETASSHGSFVTPDHPEKPGEPRTRSSF